MNDNKATLIHTIYLGVALMTLIHSASVKADLNELERQILSDEKQVSNLVEGTQKEIEWFEGKRQKTAYSIVYLHGFSATRKEISPVPETLAKKLGANIFFTRLRGHGRDSDAMLDGTVDAWLEDTKTAYNIGQQIGERVIVIGTSTGATLSTWLSAQDFANDLFANIIVSPNFALASKNAWVMQSSIGLWLVKKLQGEYRGFEPMNEYHAKYWTERYPVDALVPMLDLVDMVDKIDKSTIKTPHLMIYSPKDTVIDPGKAEKTIEEFSIARKQVVAYTDSIDPGHHVLFGYGSSDEQIKEVSDLMYNFLAIEE